ncbi:MAG: lycopene cyclase domain-containing protein [Prolixibacteraceae bacterium]
MNIYLYLLLGSLAVPLLLSFDKKLQFYKKWKFILPAISIVAAVYLAFDVLLTHLGVWGFNAEYHSKQLLLGLPLEEWLFFFVIPYASLFLHHSFILYFPNIQLTNKLSKMISFILIVIFLFLIGANYHRIYTVYILSFAVLAMVISFFQKKKILNQFLITYLIILIPFILVNAILTGTFIDGEVVWYNNEENLGIRFLTIPIEDFAYAFSMLLFSLQLSSYFEPHSQN